MLPDFIIFYQQITQPGQHGSESLAAALLSNACLLRYFRQSFTFKQSAAQNQAPAVRQILPERANGAALWFACLISAASSTLSAAFIDTGASSASPATIIAVTRFWKRHNTSLS